MELRIDTPDQQQLTVQAEKVLNVAQAYKITDDTMYQLAGQELQQIKSRITALDTQRKAITKPLDEAKARIMDLFRRPIEILQQAEQSLKKGILAYDEEKERQRREEEERLRREQEEARRKAAEAAEKARREAEEAARKAQEAANEEERKRAEEAAARAQQEAEAAQAQQQELDTAPAPIVAPVTPKVAGVSKRSTWRGECFDKMALIKAVAAGQAPDSLLDVNQSSLNSMARALKTAMNYPGCRAVEDKGIASRRSA